MKKIICCFLLLFVFNTILSQEKKFTKPDYEAIGKAVKNPDSPFFYSKLQQKFNTADSTMTVEERRYLYYGFTTQEHYNPYATDEGSEKLSEVLKKEELAAKEFDQIITFGDEILKKNPFNLRVMNYQLFAYEKKNDTVNFTKKVTQLRMVVDAILSTGKGTTADNAIYVIDVSHEYDILNLIGFEYGGTQRLIGENDYLTLAPNQYNVEGLYFDVSASKNQLMNLLNDNSFEKDDLIGTWKIIDLNHSMDKAPNSQGIAKIMVNSTMKFNKDQTFEFTTKNTERRVAELKSAFKNTKWKYDSKKKEVKIGTSKDNYSIMSFVVEKIGSKIIFQIEDSGLFVELLVEKQ
jgi:Domain of unknown function (DUF4919)